MRTKAHDIKETIPGTFVVDGAVLEYYPAGYWICSEDRAGPEHCRHIQLVLSHPQMTRCEYPEESCAELACGRWKIDLVPTPLCPGHYQMVRKHSESALGEVFEL